MSRHVVRATCWEHVSRHIRESLSSPIASLEVGISAYPAPLLSPGQAVTAAGNQETIKRSLGFQNPFVQKFKNSDLALSKRI